MSQLNLIPNPAVLGAQAGIFVATIFVVKKLFLEPYLKVRDQRAAVTTGSQNESEQMLARCEEIAKKISDQIKDVGFEVAKIRDAKRQVANTEKDQIVKSAEQAAKNELAQLQKQIRDEIQSERSKIDASVKKLSDELFKQVAAS